MYIYIYITESKKILKLLLDMLFVINCRLCNFFFFVLCDLVNMLLLYAVLCLLKSQAISIDLQVKQLSDDVAKIS